MGRAGQLSGACASNTELRVRGAGGGKSLRAKAEGEQK
jgi:hypothetical protein